jgi:polar amino acid transport system permease protein
LEAIGLWGFFREAWYCAVFAFALNTAAYQAEILRGAIESVGKGQWEAASALGLSKLQTLYKIILPQALIVALRPYGNEIILMIKGSAIVAIITVYDLMGETRRAFSRTFDFQTYLWAALLYLSLVEALRHTVDWVERRITRHLHR